MLEMLIRRVRTSLLIDVVVVATTTNSEDDAIGGLCNALGVECYRGSQDDVLGRVGAAAASLGITVHIECTGDNPLVDGRFIDTVCADFFTREKSTEPPPVCLGLGRNGLPPGLNFGIYNSESLRSLDRLCTWESGLREHAGSNFNRFTDQFCVYTPAIPAELQYESLRTDLTVDYYEDQLLISQILQLSQDKWGQQNPDYNQIAHLLDAHPEVRQINAHVRRTWSDNP